MIRVELDTILLAGLPLSQGIFQAPALSGDVFRHAAVDVIYAMPGLQFEVLHRRASGLAADVHEDFFRPGRRLCAGAILPDGDIAEGTAQEGGTNGTAGQGSHKTPALDGGVGGCYFLAFHCLKDVWVD